MVPILVAVVLTVSAMGVLGAPREVPREVQEEFLRTAVPSKASRVGKGVTDTWRVKLEGSGIEHDASFQYVDERVRRKQLPNGTVELNFVDSYRYNIAGYRLAKMVGLAHMVPASVERSWRGKKGAMTWWVDDVMGDEAELNEKGLEAPDGADWIQQTYRVRVFVELIYDTDRNQGNNLVTEDWKIWMIDFSRAFRRWHELRRPERLVRCDRELYDSLANLEREELDAGLSDILDQGERDGVWARRELILEHFKAAIEARGEDQVLY